MKISTIFWNIIFTILSYYIIILLCYPIYQYHFNKEYIDNMYYLNNSVYIPSLCESIFSFLRKEYFIVTLILLFVFFIQNFLIILYLAIFGKNPSNYLLDENINYRLFNIKSKKDLSFYNNYFCIYTNPIFYLMIVLGYIVNNFVKGVKVFNNILDNGFKK